MYVFMYTHVSVLLCATHIDILMLIICVHINSIIYIINNINYNHDHNNFSIYKYDSYLIKIKNN